MIYQGIPAIVPDGRMPCQGTRLQTLAGDMRLGAKRLVWQGNLMVNAELVVLEDVFGAQGLVAAVGQLARSVFQAVGSAAAGPTIKVAHVGT